MENNQYPINLKAGSSTKPAVATLWLNKMLHEMDCFLSLAVNKMIEMLFSRGYVKKVLHFQCIQIHSIMYKDHPDVYCFFIKSV